MKRRDSLPVLLAAGLMLRFSLTGPTASACTVPVYRYALERWPADPHVLIANSNTAAKLSALDTVGSHVNLYVTTSREAAAPDVRVEFPSGDRTWYEGTWEPGLVSRLCDSPLRRRVAHDLLTGTSVVWIFLESANAATNAHLVTMVQERLDRAAAHIQVPETPDYGDDAMFMEPDTASNIPVSLKFKLYRVSRRDPEETFLVRQITGLDPAFESPDLPVLVAVFGRARMIPLAGADIAAALVDDLCFFLGSHCSCGVKMLNPGVDLLMCANWGEAMMAYPDSALTRLPDKTHFTIGGTNALSLPEPPPSRPDEVTDSSGRAAWRYPIGMAALVLAGFGLLILLRRRG